MSVTAKIKSMLRWGATSLLTDENGQFPIQQYTYHGKTGDAVNWFAYGYHASPPSGQMAMLYSMQGNTEARVAFPGSPEDRPTIAENEVTVYHPTTGSKVHFKADGSIEVVTTVKVKLDTPTVELTGDATIAGDLAVTGNITANEVTAGTTVLTTHKHSAGAYKGDSTAIPAGPVTGIGGAPV